MEGLKQQYCLKWNNHKNNISGVFDRLRLSERFVDVTLASADQKSIKCHRILLSAGSGYLEEILDQNPSDHPTVVLSQIMYNELKHLVDFMYTGEVAVEQDNLAKLLEAANILQIKGLYESGDSSQAEQKQAPAPDHESPKAVTDFLTSTTKPISDAVDIPKCLLNDLKPDLPPKPQLTGSQKRKKRKSTSSSLDSILEHKGSSLSKKIKREDSITPPDSPNVYSPMFGISNAYFLSQTPPTTTAIHQEPKLTSPAKKQLLRDIPNLLSQHPLSPTSLIQNLQQLTNTAKQPQQQQQSNINFDLTASQLLSSAPVRRYKQYTEDTLQSALKEIMEGQSINRSSMKYNIPARTLRDWMKRLNIKSVFTHHSQKDGRSLSADSSDYNSIEESRGSNAEDHSSSEEPQEKENDIAFPGMKLPETSSDLKIEEEEEEEIDDDEEGTLSIDSKE